ncbi:MAG: hypothetical protein ACFNLW_08405, partial [Olsenella sp.]
HSPRDAQVLGPETNAAGKGGGDVISTHTNSRSLLYLNSCARIYGKGISVGGREADRPDWPFLPDDRSLGKAYVE